MTYSDVTRQVKAENELRESEEHFRLVVEGSEQVFFYEHDTQGRFTYLSAQALTSGERAEPYTALTKHEDRRDVALELIERPLISDGAVLGLPATTEKEGIRDGEGGPATLDPASRHDDASGTSVRSIRPGSN